MSRYIDADALKARKQLDGETYRYYIKIEDVYSAPSIDLTDYVPKDFHDKTCEAMAKRHQEEIANMVSVVRCKECKHWDTADGECYADRGIYFPKADDYCSYGEREGE